MRALLALDDNVFEIKLTPNKADCLSVLGVAREVSALTRAKLTPPGVDAIRAQGDAMLAFTITDADGMPNRNGKFAMLSNNSMVPESGTLVVFLGLVMIGLVAVHTYVSRE